LTTSSAPVARAGVGIAAASANDTVRGFSATCAASTATNSA
jgi:hypothetical protein